MRKSLLPSIPSKVRKFVVAAGDLRKASESESDTCSIVLLVRQQRHPAFNVAVIMAKIFARNSRRTLSPRAHRTSPLRSLPSLKSAQHGKDTQAKSSAECRSRSIFATPYQGHSSSSTNSKIGRLMVAVIFRLWPETDGDVAVIGVFGVLGVRPSGSGTSIVAGTVTAAIEKRRLCPSGRSFRLGARGRCRPRARPPTCGSSKVADRHRYRTMSYARRAIHGPNVTTASRNWCHVSCVSGCGNVWQQAWHGVRRF